MKMPYVIYGHAAGTNSDIRSLERFERFLDDSHEEMPKNLHAQLIEFHAAIDDEVAEKLEELQSEIDELKARIEVLEGEE
jgi:hypothetical protein